MRPIWNWKKRQKELESQCGGTEEERYQLAVDFGALLSYPEQGIRRLIEKTKRSQKIKQKTRPAATAV